MVKLDLQGEKLIVVATENSPHVLKNFMTDKDVSKIGYEMRLLRELCNKFNFTYQLIDTKGDTGSILPNGTWSGLVGQLVAEKADLGFGGLTMTQDRMKVVDYLMPPHFSGPITFITSWPKTEKSTLMIRMDQYIILCLFLSVILIMFTLKMVAHYYEDLKRLPIYWTILVIAFRQDINRKISQIPSVQIVMCTWMLAAMFVNMLLGGFIYKSISVPTQLQTIDTLLELSTAMKSKSIEVLINKNSARYTELGKSNRGEIQDIFERLIGLKNGQQGVKAVRNSKKPLAYIDYRIKFDYELHKKGEKTYHIPPDDPDANVRDAHFAFAVKKGFKYKNPFRKYVKNMVTNGMTIYWLRQQKYAEGFVYQNEIEKNDQGNDEEDLSAIIKTVIYIIVVGLGVSIVILVLEITHGNLKFFIDRNKYKKNNKLASLFKKHCLLKSFRRRLYLSSNILQ